MAIENSIAIVIYEKSSIIKDTGQSWKGNKLILSAMGRKVAVLAGCFFVYSQCMVNCIVINKLGSNSILGGLPSAVLALHEVACTRYPLLCKHTNAIGTHVLKTGCIVDVRFANKYDSRTS